MLFSR